MMKKATKVFCMEKLSEIELTRRVLWKVYFAIDNKKKLNKFSLVCVDRYQRYFIYNTSYLKPGITYARDRLRQLDEIPNADPVFVEFDINKPSVAERYYSRNSKID